jgi:hypothetical protein
MPQVRQWINGKIKCKQCYTWKYPDNFYVKNENKNGSPRYAGACKHCMKFGRAAKKEGDILLSNTGGILRDMMTKDWKQLF